MIHSGGMSVSPLNSDGTLKTSLSAAFPLIDHHCRLQQPPGMKDSLTPKQILFYLGLAMVLIVAIYHMTKPKDSAYFDKLYAHQPDEWEVAHEAAVAARTPKPVSKPISETKPLIHRFHEVEFETETKFSPAQTLDVTGIPGAATLVTQESVADADMRYALTRCEFKEDFTVLFDDAVDSSVRKAAHLMGDFAGV